MMPATIDTTKIRIQQLASAASMAAGDASINDYKQRVYEATCEVLTIMRREALEEAAKAVSPKSNDPESQWERGYWAAENTSAHIIRALIENKVAP